MLAGAGKQGALALPRRGEVKQASVSDIRQVLVLYEERQAATTLSHRPAWEAAFTGANFPPAPGVILDPVYSGKAWVALAAEMAADPGAWAGRRVLFLHTGGLLGAFDKADQLQPLVAALGRCERMAVGCA